MATKKFDGMDTWMKLKTWYQLTPRTHELHYKHVTIVKVTRIIDTNEGKQLS